MQKEIESQKLVIKINSSIQQLKQIAMNVNSYASSVAYLEAQIELEEKMKKSGWPARVKQLKDAVETSKYLSKLAKSNEMDQQMRTLRQKEQELRNFDIEKFAESQIINESKNQGGSFFRSFFSW